MFYLSLDGLDAEVLHARFKAIRNHAGIPEGIATTCCLVADEVALNSVVIDTITCFTETPANYPGSWYNTLSIYDINADCNGPDVRGEMVLPIPKIVNGFTSIQRLRVMQSVNPYMRQHKKGLLKFLGARNNRGVGDGVYSKTRALRCTAYVYRCCGPFPAGALHTTAVVVVYKLKNSSCSRPSCANAI